MMPSHFSAVSHPDEVSAAPRGGDGSLAGTRVRRSPQPIVLIGCLIGITAPLLACLIYGSDFLDLANESMAYRYFFVARLTDGDPVAIGVGYLLAAIQQVIYAALAPASISADTLRQQIQAFALWTNATITIGMGAVVVAAFKDRFLSDTDRWLVSIVALVPIWATHLTGFDYAVMADYHVLNLALVTVVTWLFLREWRRGPFVPSPGHLFLLGAVLGAMVANKVTLAVVGAPMLVPSLVAMPVDVRGFARRCVAAAAGGIAAFLAVIVVSYRFDLGALPMMFPVWSAFVSNPGAEPRFWTATFPSFVFRHGYAAMALFSCFCIMVFLRQAGGRGWTLRERAFIAVAASAALGSIWFVLRRPAGSTLFESSVFVLALGAMALGAASDPRRWIVPTAGAFWIVYATLTFGWHDAFETVRLSRMRGDLKWKHYEEVRQLADGRPITVVFPDNSYHHEGVFELLLKGAVEFPTWQIEDGGRRTLARYAPGVSYRTELGGAHPEAPYGGDTVLVWYASETMDPLLKYTTLAAAVARCTDAPREWRLEGRRPQAAASGQMRVVARACVLRHDPYG